MRNVIISAIFALSVVCAAFTEERYALVIGNAAYTTVSRLSNPANDARDIEAALKTLGFAVDTLINANLASMEDAAIRLRSNLTRSADACGFFFYAGHGVQADGRNYLIPVDADVKAPSFLKTKAFDVQTLLDELNEANNQLNIVVLDACRDNPFGWSRSGMRGLNVVERQPAGSIIVYATSAGKTAADGTGRNGLFTSQLLNHLTTAGLEVNEIFKRTGADVEKVSNREQSPAVYNQFFGNVYFTSPPSGASPAYTPPPPAHSSASTQQAPSVSGAGQSGAFSGLWNTVISYKQNGVDYRDRYALTLHDDGSCDITITSQDGKTQSGEGYWQAEGGIFKLEADFWDGGIPRLPAVKWVSVYSENAGGRQLKVNIKPAPDYSGVTGVTLNRSR